MEIDLSREPPSKHLRLAWDHLRQYIPHMEHSTSLPDKPNFARIGKTRQMCKQHQQALLCQPIEWNDYWLIMTHLLYDRVKQYKSFYSSAHKYLAAWERSELVGFFLKQHLVGYAVYEMPYGNLSCHLLFFEIFPPYQGMGIGRQAMDCFLAFAKPSKLTLRATEASAPFYTKLGFVSMGDFLVKTVQREK